VQPEQLHSDIFSKQRFPVSFMLAPPVLEAQSAREMFERGYLMDLQDACGTSFNEFGKSVCAAREMRETAQGMRQTTNARINSQNMRNPNTSHVAATSLQRNNVLANSTTLSSQYSILGRHRMQKIRPEEMANKSAPHVGAPQNTHIASMGIPQFLKRMSMGVLNK
jgi:hypothetical protein